MAFTTVRNNNRNQQQNNVPAVENAKDKATAKRYAGLIMGSDEELKALCEYAKIKPLMHGIPDANNNWYYHLKLVNEENEVVGDVQFCDFVDGKYNNTGIRVGSNYTSYRISDVRRDLKYIIMRYTFIGSGVIDPNASIVDVDDYEAPEETKKAENLDEEIPM